MQNADGPMMQRFGVAEYLTGFLPKGHVYGRPDHQGKRRCRSDRPRRDFGEIGKCTVNGSNG